MASPPRAGKGPAALWVSLAAVAVVGGIVLTLVLTASRGKGTGADTGLPTTADIGHHTTLAPGRSGTPPVDVSPLPGVRVTAPADSLDRPRDISATMIDGDRLRATLQQMPKNGDIPVMGFDLDAGMKPEEVLPGALTVSLDLAGLGVPEDVWDSLELHRVGADGGAQRMVSRREGSRLTFQTRKNCPYILSIILGLTVIGGHIFENSKKFPNGPYSSDDFKAYTLWWPDRLEPANKAEVERVRLEIERVMTSHGWDPSSKSWYPPGETRGITASPSYGAMKWREVRNDPEFAGLKSLTEGLGWKRDNLWPAKVVAVSRALDFADQYLSQVRKFRKPSSYLFNMDIVMLDPWPAEYGPDILGIAEDFATTYPFLHVNVQDGLSDVNGLNITVVHELFHAFQKEYYTMARDSMLWFLEAAAVTLEYEAQTYYLAKGWSSAPDILTDRDAWETLRYPMQDPADDENASRNHGYTLSNFLENLRDDAAYNPHGKDQFLPKLMESFSGYLTGPVAALYGFASKSAKDLADRFLDFCRSRSDEMYPNVKKKADNQPPGKLVQGVNAGLSPASPVYEWAYKEERPLSCAFLCASLAGFDAAARKDATVVLINGAAESLAKRDVHHRVSTSSKTAWQDMDDRWRQLPVEGADDVRLQRIEAFASTSWRAPDERLTVVVMARPKAPRVEQEGEDLVVEMEQSELRRRGLVKTRIVTVCHPASEKPYQVTTDLDRLVLEMKKAEGKLTDITLKDAAHGTSVTVTASDMKNMMDQYAYLTGATPTLKVFYQEVLYIPPTDPPETAVGPPSIESEFKTEAPPPAVVDVMGKWAGTVSLTGLTMTMEIGPGPAGYDIQVAQTIGGEGGQEFAGKRAVEAGKVVYQLFIKEGSMYLGPVQTIHILPDGRLTMFAPNVTLTRQ